jgi:hypothetical protein
MRNGHSFMGATLMCGFFIIAFKFGPDGAKWFWTGQEIIPIILGISAVIFGSFWFFDFRKKKIERRSR